MIEIVDNTALKRMYGLDVSFALSSSHERMERPRSAKPSSSGYA